MKCFRHEPGKVCPDCGLDRRNKMKIKVQAQHLQPGDIVGSGEKIKNVIINSIHWPSNKVCVELDKRVIYWGKYTMINVERG